MKNRTVAAALAFLGAFIGLHNFYLGKTTRGIMSFIFSGTGIPTIISVVEGIKLFNMSDAEFDFKYNKDQYHQSILDAFGKGAISGGSQAQKLDVADELTKLASLMDKGLITFEEFEKRKATLLK